MRPLGAITAAFLFACAIPLSGHAGGLPAATGATAQPPAFACDGPPARQAWRPHRHHVRHHAWHRRHGPAPRIAAAPPPPYDPPIPSPWDSAYDRAMTLHFRSPAVTGSYLLEPGYPPTPPVLGIQHYRVPAGPVVFQYDGVTGQYIQLAQRDAQRAFPPR